MKILCVDDDANDLRAAVSMCEKLPRLEAVHGFSSPAEALSWLKDHPADIALLDIAMPGMDGIALAREILAIQPETAVLFLTAHPGYALEAFEVHAAGYMLKPVSAERLASEVEYALARPRPRRAPLSRVSVQTFGQFEVFAEGKTVAFRRAKARELLAFLVDRRGGSVTRAEAFAILWEEIPYDRGMQKQLDVIIRSLRKTLSDCGIGDILEMKSGSLRIVPEKIDCDMYRLTDGDRDAFNAFRGEYMSAYSWASLTESYLLRRFFSG